MAESFIQLAPDSTGKKAHTKQRTIGANTVEDEVVISGEPYLATYRIVVGGISTATAASHPLQIMAGASLKVRLRRLWVYQDGLPASATQLTFQILRLTTAGTGGTAATPRKMDPADSAAGATGMTLPTSKGTEGDILDQLILGFVSAAPVNRLNSWEYVWSADGGGPPIIIAAGTANGIALKNTTAVAATSVTIVAEISESNF